mmetsp:Transcript_16361/g.25427  ORF Transcript_16361/g.25427 Transcript_16361/m.25427 type:complete len:216 (-) Transcript_16361:322-969(-)
MTLLPSTKSIFLVCSIFLLFVSLPRTTSFASIVVSTSTRNSNKLLLDSNRAKVRDPGVLVLKSERSDATDFFYGRQQQQQQQQHRRVAPIYEKKPDKPKEKTLYDILGASPTATKAEIKKLYIALAKQTHPDAQIGRTSSNSSSREDLPEFTEIAKAWAILSDSHKRQKYDRDLAGEAFADEIIAAGELVIRLAIMLGQETLQALDRFRAEKTAT